MVLEGTLESPLDCKEIKPVNTKENQFWIFIGRTDAEVEAPIVWPSDVKNWLIGKDPDAGKDWRQEEKGMTEDEMVEWHHWLNGHEFEHAPEVGDGQGSLVWCSPQGCKMLDMTEQLNWTSKMPSIQFCDLFKDLLSSVGCVTFKGRFYVFNIILYLWWVVACWMFQLKCTEHDMFEK